MQPIDDVSEPSELVKNVESWLEKEGYPTEFRAASLFRSHGFSAVQGTYVPGDTESTRREIDVVASVTQSISESFLRISYVAECKWSGDKPWVVFTSPTSRMAPSACVAQTIASELGQAITWTMAGDERLHCLHTFETPSEGGFGGRQAFSKGADVFYSAIQAAVANASSYVKEYDQYHRKNGTLPKAAVIAFPVVIIDGDLMLASFDCEANRLRLKPAGLIRCHWKGSPKWDFFATVDVVSMRNLGRYLTDRSKDLDTLLPVFTEAYENLKIFADSGSKEAMKVTSGPRGYVGFPSLVREILLAHTAKKSRYWKVKI